MSSSTRRIIAALVLALLIQATSGAAQTGDAFDTITYRDSGGFAGGGTGVSMSVMGDGTLDARTSDGRRATLQLDPREVADLRAAVAAIDWPQIQHTYRVPGAADLVTRDLIVVIHAKPYETHAESLAKTPAPLHELFDRLDTIYRRAVGPAKR